MVLSSNNGLILYVKGNTMMNNNFIENEKGQGMVEYILLVMLIAIVALGAFAAFGRSVENKANDANTEISNIG